jgi:hypothetical protein
MRNPKSKTIRKIGPASTTSILPTRTCPPHADNGTQASSQPRNTEHATRFTPAINPSLHQSNNPSAARTRNGKIARLPFPARDMVNRMLRNNIPHSQIVEALDELQLKVTERNISNWKTRGGYRDWCIEQDRALETRLLQDNLLAHLRTNDASQLAEIGLQMAATELSQFFLKSETRAQLNTEPEKLARTIGILCRLARQIHVLQKYRDQSAKELGDEHHPERLKRDTDETLENLRDIYSADKPAQSVNDPDISHRNFLPKNGFPADPPRHEPPRDDTQFHHDHFQKLCDIIAAKNAQREAEAVALYRKLHGSAAPAASSDSPAESQPSDESTPFIDQPEPDDSGQSHPQ